MSIFFFSASFSCMACALDAPQYQNVQLHLRFLLPCQLVVAFENVRSWVLQAVVARDVHRGFWAKSEDPAFTSGACLGGLSVASHPLFPAGAAP